MATQTAGRPICPKSLQRRSVSSWTHATPAGFPNGIPGIGELMDGAMQHAPQPGLQAPTAGEQTGGFSIAGRLARVAGPPDRRRLEFAPSCFTRRNSMSS